LACGSNLDSSMLSDLAANVDCVFPTVYLHIAKQHDSCHFAVPMLRNTTVAAELDQTVRYFHEALGLTVAPVAWDAESLPHCLRQLYTFHQVDLLGRNCLLMLDTDPAERAPAHVRKHIQVIRRHVDADIIYVPRQLTAYNRKRLVAQKVAFGSHTILSKRRRMCDNAFGGEDGRVDTSTRKRKGVDV